MATDPFDTKVTRVRIEGTGKSADHLRLALTEAAAKIHEEHGGHWVVEEVTRTVPGGGDPNVDIQTTKEGYWGRISVRRHHL